MYIILIWMENGNYVTHVTNSNGSIRLFNSVFEADEYANGAIRSNNMRVISMDGVHT